MTLDMGAAFGAIAGAGRARHDDDRALRLRRAGRHRDPVAGRGDPVQRGHGRAWATSGARRERAHRRDRRLRRSRLARAWPRPAPADARCSWSTASPAPRRTSPTTSIRWPRWGGTRSLPTSGATAPAPSPTTRRPTASRPSPPTCSACSTPSAGSAAWRSATRWAAWSCRRRSSRRPSGSTALILMDTSHRGLRADPELVELGVAIARTEGIAAVMAAQDALGPDQPLGTGPHQRLLETREGYKEFGDRKMLASSAAMYAAMLQTITAADERSTASRPAPRRACPRWCWWGRRTRRSASRRSGWPRPSPVPSWSCSPTAATRRSSRAPSCGGRRSSGFLDRV